MNYFRLQRTIGLILVLTVATSPIVAQRKPTTHTPPPPPAPAEPDPTFDTLLASDTFKVYCEVRSVGSLIRSSALTDILDPILKIGKPPKEFKLLVKWLNAHAETLGGSRLLVAGWPSRQGIPNAVVAVEFSSPEEAKKFYPELRDFLPRLFPAPTPEQSAVPSSSPSVAPNGSTVRNNTGQTPTIIPAREQAKLPYQLNQVGSLILISDTPFSVRDLRPRGTRGLEEDPNFAMARSRLSSESLFLYIDFKAIEKEELDRRKQAEEEERKREEESGAHPPKEEKTEELEEVDPGDPNSPVIVTPEPESQETPATLEGVPQSQPTLETRQPTEESVRTAEFGSMMSLFSMAAFAGDRKWPEAMGLAVNFEGDAYVARSLIVNGDEIRDRPIPFIPQLISGPPITPQAPDVLPADVDLFVTTSLNYEQIYENTLNAIEKMRLYSGDGNKTSSREKGDGPIANLEKKLGLKIKDDLLPLLGNEFALVLPKAAKKVDAPGSDATNTSDNTVEPTTNPIIAIGIKDRDAVQKVIPKLLEATGLKGANLIAQKENHDGAEIVSYGPFSYALIDNFLVFSSDSAETRRTVDAYVNHQTLSSDSNYRNSTRWQPRQVLGQLYVGPKIVQQYIAGHAGENMTNYLGHVNPVIDPLTYSITNDSSGSFHELHVPKNLVQMVVAIASSDAAESPMRVNEARVKGALHSIAAVEQEFRIDKGAGSYGTLDQLLSAGLTSKELLEGYGYHIEVMVSSAKFEVTAVPLEYGTTGRLSFFIDESNMLRGGDHGGGAATVADKPLGQ